MSTTRRYVLTSGAALGAALLAPAVTVPSTALSIAIAASAAPALGQHTLRTLIGKRDAPGLLSFPTGVALDREGNVYVADFGNHRVQSFTPAGQLRARW